MRPNEPSATPQNDLFRQKLVNLLDLRHELCRLADRIEWQSLADQFGCLYAEAGRPGVPIRLMTGLHYLKHSFALSDEQVVNSWVENPYWQYFCGAEYFCHELPIDPSQMTRFRTRLGAAGCEQLLALTIRAGLATQSVQSASFKQVTVDTTVQEKAVAFPTDARLYHKTRVALVRVARRHRIELRQSYTRKGKVHKKCEFGVKVSLTTTQRDHFIVGAASLPGNPYDGHTLQSALAQVKRLTGTAPEHCFVDRGYKGHAIKTTAVPIPGQKRGITWALRRAIKRRNAIEPIIGHLKNDGLLGRNFLKGATGDAMNVILAAAGHNLRIILRKLRLSWLCCLRALLGVLAIPKPLGASTGLNRCKTGFISGD